jgi:signal transduction histidine kinase
VILNLVRNAIEAMVSTSPPGERRLYVQTRLDGASDLLLSIEDSGPGIVAGDRDRIFDPFFTTKAAGMGLGLAICRTIVEEHGGNLRVTKTDSKGSIFEIALPIASTRNSRA